MEFRYRAVDDRPPPPPFPSPMPGRFFTPMSDLRPNLGSGYSNFEKDRISEEILLREIARRYEIEAEMRREIMCLEWDLAMLRAGMTREVGFGDRFAPMPSNSFEYKSVPVSSSTSEPVTEPSTLQLENVTADVKAATESSKDRLIELEKPSSKRKALDSDELNHAGLTKKPRGEWSCTLCHYTAAREKFLNNHLRSKKHIVKVERLRGITASVSNKTKKPKLAKLLPIDSNGVDNNGGDSANGYKYWCDICEKGAFSLTVMEDHKKGKKHLAKLAECKDRNGEEDALKTAHISPDAIIPTTEAEISSANGNVADDPALLTKADKVVEVRLVSVDYNDLD